MTLTPGTPSQRVADMVAAGRREMVDDTDYITDTLLDHLEGGLTEDPLWLPSHETLDDPRACAVISQLLAQRAAMARTRGSADWHAFTRLRSPYARAARVDDAPLHDSPLLAGRELANPRVPDPLRLALGVPHDSPEAAVELARMTALPALDLCVATLTRTTGRSDAMTGAAIAGIGWALAFMSRSMQYLGTLDIAVPRDIEAEMRDASLLLHRDLMAEMGTLLRHELENLPEDAAPVGGRAGRAFAGAVAAHLSGDSVPAPDATPDHLPATAWIVLSLDRIAADFAREPQAAPAYVEARRLAAHFRAVQQQIETLALLPPGHRTLRAALVAPPFPDLFVAAFMSRLGHLPANAATIAVDHFVDSHRLLADVFAGYAALHDPGPMRDALLFAARHAERRSARVTAEDAARQAGADAESPPPPAAAPGARQLQA